MKFVTGLLFSGLLILPSLLEAAVFVENFDDVAALDGQGWVRVNNSDSPDGSYFQGNATVFTAHQGADNSYAGVNFASTSGSAATGITISNWLILPTMTVDNGNVFSFFSRTVTDSGFPDRLELRLSTNGTSTDVGTSPTDVGDFTNLLVSINPNLQVAGYPDTWTEFQASLSGLAGPTEGRFAFRYFVTDGGPLGNNSNYIGIDTVSFVPEPGSGIVLLGLAAGSILQRRRRLS